MMSTSDDKLDSFLQKINERGVEPLAIDPRAGANGIFAVEATIEINGEQFESVEVDYEVMEDQIGWYFAEIYIEEDDERKPVLDSSDADLIDTTGQLLYEYKPSEDEIEETLNILREVYSEVYN